MLFFIDHELTHLMIASFPFMQFGSGTVDYSVEALDLYIPNSLSLFTGTLILITSLPLTDCHDHLLITLSILTFSIWVVAPSFTILCLPTVSSFHHHLG